jgi:hypothetical protein
VLLLESPKVSREPKGECSVITFKLLITTLEELVHECNKVALVNGEGWRLGEGAEFMDAINSAQEKINIFYERQ